MYVFSLNEILCIFNAKLSFYSRDIFKLIQDNYEGIKQLIFNRQYVISSIFLFKLKNLKFTMIFYQSTHIHIHTYINKMFDYVLIINFLNDAGEFRIV